MKWNNVAGALALSLMLGCAIAGSGSEYATHVRECVTLKDGMPVLTDPSSRCATVSRSTRGSVSSLLN